jgi:hypothetical protein
VKKVNGRKRHLLVDTLGLILAVLVHAADVSERDGARWLLGNVLAAKQAGRGCFERLQHLWLDAGYQGKEWLAWVEAALGLDRGDRAQASPVGLVSARRRTPADTRLHRAQTPLGGGAHLCVAGRLPALE